MIPPIYAAIHPYMRTRERISLIETTLAQEGISIEDRAVHEDRTYAFILSLSNEQLPTLREHLPGRSHRFGVTYFTTLYPRARHRKPDSLAHYPPAVKELYQRWNQQARETAAPHTIRSIAHLFD
ncbi:MAG: hypothetical protein WC595_04195 [Candidatus Nanoarchaeia archaeon]